MSERKIRNVAIIAHVDHGKTTLVDQLLQQGGSFRDNEEVEERVMDNDAIEKERGITILSKNTSINYKGYRVNIVDTPGHADFGGQVERVLGTVDSVLLVVDAWEGPMAQTRFVTKKALERGIKPIVVINKIDRDGCRPERAHDMVFDLFCELDATEEQLEFPYIFASGRAGTCRLSMEEEDTDLIPLLDMIIRDAPAPSGDDDAEPLLQISSLEHSDFMGRLAVGRIEQGSLSIGQTINHATADGKNTKVRIQKIFRYEGIVNTPIEKAVCGDIISMAGFPTFDIGDTVSSIDNPVELNRPKIDPPTISMTFTVNDSPLVGQFGGKFLTGNHLQERLERAMLADPALTVDKTDGASAYRVSGRGVMHLTILIENMRRELYEFSVGAPQVLYKTDDNGQKLEPFEILTVDVPQEFSGAVIEQLGTRKSEMQGMEQDGDLMRVTFRLPSRGLIGLRTTLLSMTRGYAVMQTLFDGYEPYAGEIPTRHAGALISNVAGTSMAYSLFKLDDRGDFVVPPQTEIYEGMIVGISNRNDDMVLNICKNKALTNVRSSGADDALTITPYKDMSLEEAVVFINPDELVEVTPEKLRLRKQMLKEVDRKRKK
jgi:GTP-binding protein